MAVSRKQFVRLLIDSGLMSADEVRAFQKELPEAPADAQQLARQLVRSGRITRFQAAALYQAKPKGLILGNYVVLDKIGAGGMGNVFCARHRRMDRLVAIKVLSDRAMDTPAAVERFHREVRAAARLNHPNIVTAYDADELEGIHYLVMEYVKGDDLASVAKRDGPLPIAGCLNYILQAAQGLAYAHDRNIVHRDVKPNNLLLDREGNIKILDMGLASLESAGATKAAAVDPDEEAQEGQVIGTINYMAPEQGIDIRKADARSDIYSLGCTMYRLLTGRSVYTDDTRMERLVAHREAAIPSLRAVRRDVPEPLDEMFQKMVAKRPEDRYQSMHELLVALEAMVTSQSPPPPPVDRKASDVRAQVSAARRTADRDALALEDVGSGRIEKDDWAPLDERPFDAEVIPQPPPLPAVLASETVNYQLDQDTSVSLTTIQRRRPRRWPIYLLLSLSIVALGVVLLLMAYGMLP